MMRHPKDLARHPEHPARHPKNTVFTVLWKGRC